MEGIGLFGSPQLLLIHGLATQTRNRESQKKRHCLLLLQPTPTIVQGLVDLVAPVARKLGQFINVMRTKNYLNPGDMVLHDVDQLITKSPRMSTGCPTNYLIRPSWLLCARNLLLGTHTIEMHHPGGENYMIIYDEVSRFVPLIDRSMSIGIFTSVLCTFSLGFTTQTNYQLLYF